MTIYTAWNSDGSLTLADGDQLMRLAPGEVVALRQTLLSLPDATVRQARSVPPCCELATLKDTVMGQRYFCIRHGKSAVIE